MTGDEKLALALRNRAKELNKAIEDAVRAGLTLNVRLGTDQWEVAPGQYQCFSQVCVDRITRTTKL